MATATQRYQACPSTHSPNAAKTFAKLSPVPLAMRELHIPPRSVRRAGFVGVWIILWTVAGPFGTFVELSFWERFLYWGIAATACGAVFHIALYGATRIEPFASLPAIGRIATAAAIVAVPGGVLMVLLNAHFRGAPSSGLGWYVLYVGLLACAIGCIEHALSLGLEAVRNEFQRSKPHGPTSPDYETSRPKIVFLQRLPNDVGHDLVSLSMQDHYVHVTTAVGSTMILIRFADALNELDGYGGMQIHRSHWVATEKVERLVRDNRRIMVELSDGRRLPVSRTYVDAVRKALPAR